MLNMTTETLTAAEVNPKLEELVKRGTIFSYKIENFDANGNPGRGNFRNTEKLTIVFLTGEKITVDTFCSGSAEDTCLFVS